MTSTRTLSPLERALGRTCQALLGSEWIDAVTQFGESRLDRSWRTVEIGEASFNELPAAARLPKNLPYPHAYKTPTPSPQRLMNWSFRVTWAKFQCECTITRSPGQGIVAYSILHGTQGASNPRIFPIKFCGWSTKLLCRCP